MMSYKRYYLNIKLYISYKIYILLINYFIFNDEEVTFCLYDLFPILILEDPLASVTILNSNNANEFNIIL